MSGYRDSDSESKTIRELRKMIKKLNHEIRYLRKQNRALETQVTEPDEEECVEVIDEPKEVRYTCHKCGAYTKNIFEIVGRKYYKCEGCGSRGRIDKKSQ